MTLHSDTEASLGLNFRDDGNIEGGRADIGGRRRREWRQSRILTRDRSHPGPAPVHARLELQQRA